MKIILATFSDTAKIIRGGSSKTTAAGSGRILSTHTGPRWRLTENGKSRSRKRGQHDTDGILLDLKRHQEVLAMYVVIAVDLWRAHR